MNRRNLIFAHVLVGIVVGLFGTMSHSLADQVRALEQAASEIQEKNKRIPREVLANDLQVILGSYERLRKILNNKGINDQNDIDGTIVLNWKMLRIGHDLLDDMKMTEDEELNEIRFHGFFDGLEKCFIKSKPEQGADIYIETNKHSATTNAVLGLRPDNSYKVRLKKGPKSAEGELKVIKGGENTFEGELK